MHGFELSAQDLKRLRVSGLGGKRDGSLLLWLLLSYRPRIWEFALKLEALNSQGFGAFVVDSVGLVAILPQSSTEPHRVS